MLTEALITNRDGIVGTRIDRIADVLPGVPDSPRNLPRLALPVRAAIFQAELGPSVDLTVDTHDNLPVATLWRRTSEREGRKRKVTFHEMVEMTGPTTEQLTTQLKHVAGYARIRPDRAAEITTQVGVPTAFFASIGFMDPARTPHTLELLYTALNFSSLLIQRTKYALAVKRPIEFSPQVQPMIETPTHGSLPSGHATEAFLIARLLWKLLIESEAPQYGDRAYWGSMLMRQAARVATNRTVAGVHFPIDSVAGAMLGLTLADHMHAMCNGGAWTSAIFDAPKFDPDHDFDWHQLYTPEGDEMKPKASSDRGAWAITKRHDRHDTDETAPALSWLWTKALGEWRDLQECDG
ncbi:phosphatase PAP2 family protein [Tateyamaria omphalii]|uniref:phosphatase PAP2 family protein n=1 Tax=Tateyamaria omphalii TaxID=299262 RepID=UPI001C9947FF|nr:phosphatase PAP2 family protein [Tateyamaria omphalii]MBY5934724.1 phosphatase PAP2 family protein [Tateyamaria omphalii]